MDEERTEHKVVVAGYNQDGESDFWFVIVNATDAQVAEGKHKVEAEGHAYDHGFDPRISYDEEDRPTGLFGLFMWASASVIEVNEAAWRTK